MTRTEMVARTVVVAVVPLIGLFGAIAGRAMYADGAYALWFLVMNGSSPATTDRLFGAVLSQGPAVLSVWAGVHDIPALIVIEGLGQVGLVTGAWALALVVLFRHRLFWVFVVAFAVVYLNSGFVTIGDYNLAYALVALSAAVLLHGNDRRPWHAVALITSAVVLLRSYESLVFLGPLLVLFASLALRDLGHHLALRGWQIVIWAAILLLALSTILSCLNIMFPRDARNRDHAGDLLSSLSLNPQLAWSASIGVAFVTVAYFARERLASPLLGMVAVLAMVLVVPQVWSQPVFHYATRVTTGVVLFALLSLGFTIERFALRSEPSPSSWKPLVPLVLLTALLVPFTFHTVGYGRWLADFQEVLETESGSIYVAETVLAAESHYYSWGWTHPCISVLLRPPGSSAIVEVSHDRAAASASGLPPLPCETAADTVLP